MLGTMVVAVICVLRCHLEKAICRMTNERRATWVASVSSREMVSNAPCRQFASHSLSYPFSLAFSRFLTLLVLTLKIRASRFASDTHVYLYILIDKSTKNKVFLLHFVSLCRLFCHGSFLKFFQFRPIPVSFKYFVQPRTFSMIYKIQPILIKAYGE